MSSALEHLKVKSSKRRVVKVTVWSKRRPELEATTLEISGKESSRRTWRIGTSDVMYKIRSLQYETRFKMKKKIVHLFLIIHHIDSGPIDSDDQLILGQLGPCVCTSFNNWQVFQKFSELRFAAISEKLNLQIKSFLAVH